MTRSWPPSSHAIASPGSPISSNSPGSFGPWPLKCSPIGTEPHSSAKTAEWKRAVRTAWQKLSARIVLIQPARLDEPQLFALAAELGHQRPGGLAIRVGLHEHPDLVPRGEQVAAEPEERAVGARGLPALAPQPRQHGPRPRRPGP